MINKIKNKFKIKDNKVSEEKKYIKDNVIYKNLFKKNKERFLMKYFIITLFSFFLFTSFFEIYKSAEKYFAEGCVYGTIYLSLIAFIISFIFYFITKQIISFNSLQEIKEKKSEEDIYSFYIKQESFKLELDKISVGNYNKEEQIKEFMEMLDDIAYKRISERAKYTAVFSAISNVTLIDILIVLYNNLKLIIEISEIYGYKPSLFGNIFLIKSIIKSMIVSGTTEAISNSDLIAGTVLNKVSITIGQSIINSVFTIKIGINAIKFLRPLPIEKEKSIFENIAKIIKIK